MKTAYEDRRDVNCDARHNASSATTERHLSSAVRHNEPKPNRET